LFPTKPRYFPMNLAVASAPGDGIYEFLVVWNHEHPSLPKILDVFARHKAKVVLAHSQVVEGDIVVGTFFCGLAQADRDAEHIRKEIKGLSYVQTVEVASAEHPLRQVPLPGHRVGAAQGACDEAGPAAQHRE
jgi:hypothetical protein